jgi:hypothetical protein
MLGSSAKERRNAGGGVGQIGVFAGERCKIRLKHENKNCILLDACIELARCVGIQEVDLNALFAVALTRDVSVCPKRLSPVLVQKLKSTEAGAQAP